MMWCVGRVVSYMLEERGINGRTWADQARARRTVFFGVVVLHTWNRFFNALK